MHLIRAHNDRISLCIKANQKAFHQHAADISGLTRPCRTDAAKTPLF